MLEDPVNEVKRREHALRIIGEKMKKHGRDGIYDLTGLSGGFPLEEEDLDLIETYVGPAIFEERLQEAGREHMGGEMIAAFNRTSSAILAAVLALTEPGSTVFHYLPELPSHPSVPRSAELASAGYQETEDFTEKPPADTGLVVVTGSTMDHRVVEESDLVRVIEMAHDAGITVLVDDASGARLRTVLYGQRRACDLGADLAVTSTDKLMHGPRGGLMAGRADLIERVKSKAYQFGLEAQPPLVAAMVRALEKFEPSEIMDAIKRKEEFLRDFRLGVEETPTGFIIKLSSIEDIHGSGYGGDEISTALSMILLSEYGIVTIPAVGMPGASKTLRFDLAAPDAGRLEISFLREAIYDAIKLVSGLINDDEKMRRLILG
jgi:L-seryl-tRNA(Ser) seleniumtransferase